MTPSDYEMVEQGYDPPRMNEGELVYTGPGELAALRAQNAELVAALKGVLAEADRKTDAFDRARAALRCAAPPASGEAQPARSWPVPFEYAAVENSGSSFPPPAEPASGDKP